jgi:hydantoinase/carbamoylase family amidase
VSLVSNDIGAALMRRLDALAQLTDEPGRLTRLFLSPAHRRAVDLVSGWMAEAGMSVWLDAAGSVRGRYDGATADAPALILGSHIDTVRDAGRYDGNLGVVLAIAVVAALHARGERLPFAIEVAAFGDEEGVRFPSTLLGSRALAGRFDPAVLTGEDVDGVSLEAALRGFGLDPAQIPAAAFAPDKALAYVEAHIEQGPVLEAQDKALGVVTAINGASRLRVTLTGEAGHAGTTPMRLRRDALAGAAEMILSVERRGGADPDLVATVGVIGAEPGAVNVIPGRCVFTLDLRAPDDELRLRALADLRASFAGTAQRRGLGLDVAVTHEQGAVACDPKLIVAMEAAAASQGYIAPRLPSGAGHDAMVMASLCPSVMLFVRCHRGVSHNPAESILTEDVAAAFATLLAFVRSYSP